MLENLHGRRVTSELVCVIWVPCLPEDRKRPRRTPSEGQLWGCRLIASGMLCCSAHLCIPTAMYTEGKYNTQDVGGRTQIISWGHLLGSESKGPPPFLQSSCFERAVYKTVFLYTATTLMLGTTDRPAVRNNLYIHIFVYDFAGGTSFL